MYNLAYRIDHRTIDQFSKDIKIGHEKERDIMNAYKQYVYDTYGIQLDVKPNGVDNSGKFIFGKVNTKADYLVNDKPLEIKFNNRMLDFFHFKVSQLNSYIRQDAHVLFVNGYETSCPVFTIMTPKHLRKVRKLKKPIYFEKWKKQVYRLRASDYVWKELRQCLNTRTG